MFILVTVIAASLAVGHGLENGLARTPPMGWLSWNRFMCEIDCDKYPDACINDKLYMAMADRMVEDGFKDVGYEYVMIDDCWAEKERDKVTGRQIPDKIRFPNGIKGLADYVHSKGLKLGLYGDMGTLTCGGYPGLWNGSTSLFDIDAQAFAEWGIDSLKVDGCYMGDRTLDFDWMFPMFGNSLRKATKKTGREILYYCEWPLYQLQEGHQPNYTLIAKHCNLIRPYYDISDSWVKVLNIIDYFAENQNVFAQHQRPGAYFDADMLVVGNYGLSKTQSKAHMAWWALMASPILMANDLRDLEPEHKALLQNKALIAVNQDPLGAFGKRIRLDVDDGKNVEIWAKPLSNGDIAVAYFNIRAQGSAIYISYKLNDVVPEGTQLAERYQVTDLFAQERRPDISRDHQLVMKVEPSGGVGMVRLTPIRS